MLCKGIDVKKWVSMASRLYFLGIDIGSTTSKCVILDEEGSLASTGLVPSGAGTAGPRDAVDMALKQAGIAADELAAVCATGYGRKLVDEADWQMSELSCHAKGASALSPQAKTIIDIGGQDAKVLRVENGQLVNFAMNDKCAAGTGRFLDVMASIFGCKVSDLSSYDQQSKRSAHISSTCTVFAESEVVSKLAAGESIPDIVAGIHDSVVTRVAGLARRVGVAPDIAMTGGVALNDGLRKRLAVEMGYPILASHMAQYNGAWGAALFAVEKYDKLQALG